MDSSISTHQAAPVHPRVQVQCTGIESAGATLMSVHRAAQQLLSSEADQVTLAVVQVARVQAGLHRSYTQLFGHALQHVAGYAEHSEALDAATRSIERALRALKTSERYNPWTSVHPGCQRGEGFAK